MSIKVDRTILFCVICCRIKVIYDYEDIGSWIFYNGFWFCCSKCLKEYIENESVSN